MAALSPHDLGAVCFESAVQFAARQRHIALKDSSVTAEAGVGPREPGGFSLRMAFKLSPPGIDRS